MPLPGLMRPRPIGLARPSVFGGGSALQDLVGGNILGKPGGNLLDQIMSPESALQGTRSLLAPDAQAASEAGMLTPRGVLTPGSPLGQPQMRQAPPKEEPDLGTVPGLVTGAVKAGAKALGIAKPSRAPIEMAAPESVSASVAVGTGSSFENPKQLTQNVERVPDEDDSFGDEAQKWIGRLAVMPLTVVQGLLTGNGAFPGILGSLGIGPEAAMARVKKVQEARNAGARKALEAQLKAAGSQVPAGPEGDKYQQEIANVVSSLQAYGQKTPTTGGKAEQVGFLEAFIQPRSEREAAFYDEMAPLQEEATFMQGVPQILANLRQAQGDTRGERQQIFQNDMALADDRRADAHLSLAQAANARAERGEDRADRAEDWREQQRFMDLSEYAAGQADKITTRQRQAQLDRENRLKTLHGLVSSRLGRLKTGTDALSQLRLATEGQDPASMKAAMGALNIPQDAFIEDTANWWPGGSYAVDESKIPDFTGQRSELEDQLSVIESQLIGGPSFAKGGDDGGQELTDDQLASLVAADMGSTKAAVLADAAKEPEKWAQLRGLYARR